MLELAEGGSSVIFILSFNKPCGIKHETIINLTS